MAHATAQFFGPHPLGPWGGAKRSNIIKSQSQSQFQRFLNQTLCVFSQLKDIKHIRQDFHSVAWVMPQGWDLGVPRGVGGPKNFFPKFNQIWCVSYLHEWHMQLHNFLGPRLLGPWGGAKRSNIIKGIIHTFFQMRLLYSLQYGRNNSPLNVCECPSIRICTHQNWNHFHLLTHYEAEL